jgi:hypothetical protein
MRYEIRQIIVDENGAPSPRVMGQDEEILAMADTVRNRTAPRQDQDSGTTVLPDGSAFCTATFPLPKDHWLTRRDAMPDEPPGLVMGPYYATSITTAVRWALRAATNCGKIRDFDPDTVVQNVLLALVGRRIGPAARSSD